jgi:hypothetical protein
MQQTDTSGWLTPPQIARRLRCRSSKVIVWIRKGALRAVNVAEDPNGKRPRWRISPQALEDFLTARANRAPAAPRRRKRQLQVTEFFA